MKITMTLLMLLALSITQMLLPKITHNGDSPKVRLRGSVKAVQRRFCILRMASQLAVVSTIGIWLYDTTSYQPVALLDADTNMGTKRSIQSGWGDVCRLESG